MLRSTCLAAALCAFLAAAPTTTAHHVWIEVADFTPEPGATLPVELHVGDHLPGERLPRNASRIVRFAILGGDGAGAGGERAVPGVDGVRPFGIARLGEAPGERVIVYRGNESHNRLPPERFARYLEEEGLDSIAARRAELGESDQPGSESYSRSLKALISVGGAAPAEGTRSPHVEAAGLDLELVPERRPAALRAGHELSLRLLWKGEPLAGTRVVAIAAAAPDAPQAAESDADGKVRFRLGEGGLWRLTAIHMQRADDGDPDWRSVWTALTFELPGEVPGELPGELPGEAPDTVTADETADVR